MGWERAEVCEGGLFESVGVHELDDRDSGSDPVAHRKQWMEAYICCHILR